MIVPSKWSSPTPVGPDMAAQAAAMSTGSIMRASLYRSEDAVNANWPATVLILTAQHVGASILTDTEGNIYIEKLASDAPHEALLACFMFQYTLDPLAHYPKPGDCVTVRLGSSHLWINASRNDDGTGLTLAPLAAHIKGPLLILHRMLQDPKLSFAILLHRHQDDATSLAFVPKGVMDQVNFLVDLSHLDAGYYAAKLGKISTVTKDLKAVLDAKSTNWKLYRKEPRAIAHGVTKTLAFARSQRLPLIFLGNGSLYPYTGVEAYSSAIADRVINAAINLTVLAQSITFPWPTKEEGHQADLPLLGPATTPTIH